MARGKVALKGDIAVSSPRLDSQKAGDVGSPQNLLELVTEDPSDRTRSTYEWMNNI